MTRRSDWVSRLQALIDANASREFEWGIWDCCQFAAAAVEAMTGETVQIADAHHGEYRTEAQAFDLLQSLGGLEVVLGWHFTEVPIRKAQRGDIVVADLPALFLCGIVAFSGRSAFVIGESGLQQVPLSGFQRAWRV